MDDKKESNKAKETTKRLEEIIFSKSVDWDHISRFVNILLDGVREIDNPKRMRVEIRLEDEFGENLSGERIFEMIDEEFEQNKTALDLDICRMWKMNEYVVIVGIKLQINTLEPHQLYLLSFTTSYSYTTGSRSNSGVRMAATQLRDTSSDVI